MTDNDLQPFKITTADRAVGLLIVVTLALVITFFVLRSHEIGPVDQSAHFHTILKQSYGIVRGSDITLSGLPIGQIRAISLLGAKGVQVDFSIQQDYRSLITRGSYLEVSSSLGISSLIGGATLQFIPAQEPGELINPGEMIDSHEPADLADTLGELEINKMATDVKVLIRNLREVSEVVHDNQQVFTASMQNIQTLTSHLKDSIQVVPEVAAAATQGFAQWGRAGAGIQTLVNESGGDIRQIASHTREASADLQASLAQLRQLLEHLNAMSGSMQESVERLPAILNDAHQLIRDANTVTRRLEHHWLFGGSDQPADAPRLPLSRPTPLPR